MQYYYYYMFFLLYNHLRMSLLSAGPLHRCTTIRKTRHQMQGWHFFSPMKTTRLARTAKNVF